MCIYLYQLSVKFLDSTMRASQKLIGQLYEKLPTSSKEQHVTDAIKVVVSILLYSVDQLSTRTQEHAEGVIGNSTKKLYEFLVKFMNRNYGSTAGFIFDGPKEMKVQYVLP